MEKRKDLEKTVYESGYEAGLKEARERAVKALCEIWCLPADIALCEGHCAGIKNFLKIYDNEQ